MSEDASLPVARPRRWPRIIGFLFLVALAGGVITWLAWPKKVTATALFEVRNDASSLTGNGAVQTLGEREYEILKKTQLALLKSKFLLTSALRNPSINGSPVFAGVDDAEEWLQDHLEISYPENGEILAIELRGPASQANDLRLIVDAVADAYKREVLGKETARRLTVRDMLEHSLQNLNGEIKRKYEDYVDIAKGMGRSDSDSDPEMQIYMKRMDRIDEELAQLERDQLRVASGGDNKDSKFLEARITQLRKDQNELMKTIQKRNERSVDLTTRKSELDQLQSIANDLAIKLEKLDIDNQIPAPIQQLSPATIEPGNIAVR